MKRLAPLALILVASPAYAAEEAFFSLSNPELIVTIAFLIFVGVLIYFKVPGMITGLLDRRATTIRTELEEARALRDEAQTLLASYERRQKQVAAQAEQIVEHAKREAAEAAIAAKEDLKVSIARRIAAAEEQIKSAEDAAVKEVRDSAIAVSIAAAKDLIAENLSAAEAGKLVDAAIDDVKTKLH